MPGYTDPAVLRRDLAAALTPRAAAPERSMDWIKTSYAIAAAASPIASSEWGDSPGEEATMDTTPTRDGSKERMPLRDTPLGTWKRATLARVTPDRLPGLDGPVISLAASGASRAAIDASAVTVRSVERRHSNRRGAASRLHVEVAPYPAGAPFGPDVRAEMNLGGITAVWLLTARNDQEVTMPSTPTPTGPSDADVQTALKQLAREMATPEFADAIDAVVKATDVVQPPVTTDGRQASVAAIEGAAKTRQARKLAGDAEPGEAIEPVSGEPVGQKLTAVVERRTRQARSAGKPDPKPAARKRSGTTSTKPATTEQTPQTVEDAPKPAPKAGAKVTPAQAEKRAAAAAKTKRAKATAELLKSGKIERNAITAAVAKHGDLQLAAKDAGVDVARVEAAIRPGAGAKTTRKPAKDYPQLLAAFITASGSARERRSAASDPVGAWYAVWLAGLRTGEARQPSTEKRDALRAATAKLVGKPWTQIEKSLPSFTRKAASK